VAIKWTKKDVIQKFSEAMKEEAKRANPEEIKQKLLTLAKQPPAEGK
jgi:hypothetical protein